MKKLPFLFILSMVTLLSSCDSDEPEYGSDNKSQYCVVRDRRPLLLGARPCLEYSGFFKDESGNILPNEVGVTILRVPVEGGTYTLKYSPETAWISGEVPKINSWTEVNQAFGIEKVYFLPKYVYESDVVLPDDAIATYYIHGKDSEDPWYSTFKAKYKVLHSPFGSFSHGENEITFDIKPVHKARRFIISYSGQEFYPDNSSVFSDLLIKVIQK